MSCCIYSGSLKSRNAHDRPVGLIEYAAFDAQQGQSEAEFYGDRFSVVAEKSIAIGQVGNPNGEQVMPIITVTLIEGYEQSVRTRLAERLSDVAQAVTGAPAEGVTVVLQEVASGNYMRGRRHRDPGRSPDSPCDLVRAYLEAMEARDLESASRFLADDFSMTFPGGVVFRSLEELVHWAAARYRSIRKSYEGFEESLTMGGAVVYCHGTLSGESLSGTPFTGVRFVDRFTVSDGKLQTQSVWNGLAESGAVD